jgi:UDP-N-acetylglucosamine/UDP-N-acetylgalactosamine diphosphorylase
MHIDQVRARAQQFGSRIPLYVMTSPPTHQETTQFLRDPHHFGLTEDDLTIFCQGTMPAVDFDGKLLLENKAQIFASPDGHGGTLAALANSGCLEQMRDRGVKHLFYGQVDNPLIQICHPALIGYHIQSKSEMTSQVVRKTDPLQKVGNVVDVDGVVRIIEYSDLPESQARLTNSDGTLKIWAGSIAVHVFETEFLEQCHATSGSLPFHRARKKVAYFDAAGNRVEPSEPNAIKFEKFIFDLLPSAKNSIVCEVDPTEGFCAVKNSAPADAETPEHAKQAISDLHTQWLLEAGVKVAPGTRIEINPMFAVDGEQLKGKFPADLTISKASYFEG